MHEKHMRGRVIACISEAVDVSSSRRWLQLLVDWTGRRQMTFSYIWLAVGH